jgi:septum site-determining protein MinD
MAFVGETIAVLSGKGGTGKTSITAGLATALAKEGCRVLCIDCDVGLRNLDIPLGLADTAALSFLDVCSGGYSLEQLPSHPQFPTLFFLTAPMSCSAEEVDAEAFGQMVSEARGKFDYVFLDAPAGVDAGFRLAACRADRVLLVTGSDPAAVRDAGRTGQVLELMGKDNVRLIVNRINPKLVSGMDLTVDDVMDNAGLPLIGIVPEDPNVTLSAAFGKPLLTYTKKGAAAACSRIAKRIQGLPVRIEIR